MRTDELDFELPAELIAQQPSVTRGESRLLHYQREDRRIGHRRFGELGELLCAGDLLVFNDTKVLPARFTLRKKTGGLIEGLFLEELGVGRWRVLLRNVGHATELTFDAEPKIGMEIRDSLGDGMHEVFVSSQESAAAILDRLGRMPLPPYIHRDKVHDQRDAADRERYQTVYASREGSIAAPTAGLHFTSKLLEELHSLGIERVNVTLEVGLGTFKPVSTQTLDEHKMHIERFIISAQAAQTLENARQDGRRIIAVGTTSARVLESQPAGVPFAPCAAETGIFIHPPYAWKHVSALITNFHLPRSTLIALVAAMVGLEEQRRIYAEAIAQRYRFFSYGDAMFID
jgi:S-adenosylmethionine:tRNA ribosyltransferase-isomerase